ncbi:LysR substrate-binding domain-containing protein [Erythrobacter sp. NE805]|uniref:LysR substrate-binding domain-containing protein n=1 Tax=Erythrobacter sp. NE805 TaxID=3389875 RepID=UPI00396AF9A8
MQIPSLQTLRALEAAARLGSYTRAAAELGLTHGAISHRLRALEERLGHALFTREGNGMRATPEALRLLVPVREALALLAAAFPAGAGEPQVLRVSLLPSMASRWLMPRVAKFRAAHPGIDLRIDARLELAPLAAGGVDCAIRYGSGDWPGVSVSKLGDEVLFPVCTAGYRDALGLAKPADLPRASLLRHDRQLWRPWLLAAGVDLAEPREGPFFSDTNLMLDAAIAGEGVALARERIVAGDLASGRLVRLFDIEVADRYAYFFVHPHRLEPRSRKAVECLARWVTMQFALAD